MTYQEKQNSINKIKKLIGEYQFRRDYYKVDQLKHLLKKVKKLSTG